MWKECTFFVVFFSGVTERPVWCSVKVRQQTLVRSVTHQSVVPRGTA